MKSTALVLSLAVAVVACGSRPAAGPASEELTIHYSLETKQPPMHVALDVPGRGTTRVALLRALPSEPQGLAGYFNVKLSAEQRAELERRVSQNRLLERNDEVDLAEGFSGFLRLDRGRRHAELSLGAKDAGARSLRSMLDDIVAQAAGHPLAALRLVVHARKDGPNARIETLIVHVGVKPLDVAVTPEGDPNATLRLRVVLERGGRLVNEMVASQADVRRLGKGAPLENGWRRIDAGKAWSLPPLAMPLPMDESGLFARVEVVARVRTEHREPIDIELTSASVSLGDEIRE